MNATPRVVIIGGGFGGLHFIRALERRLRPAEAEVTLVDRHNYHLFTPLLYQVATGELPSHAVAYPLRLSTAPVGVRFLQVEVEGVDVEARRVRTSENELPYDHLVIACGSITNDYGIPGVPEHALPVKWLEEAQMVRRRVIEAFERAAVDSDAARRRSLLSFIIIGAGPAGVELASSLRDLMDHTLRPMYPDIDLRREASITLLDGSERVLPQMDQRLSRIARDRLEAQQVRVLLRTLVSEIGPGHVVTRDGARLAADTIVWAGGVQTNPLVRTLPLEHAKDDRVVVDALFHPKGHPEIIVVGDAAYFDQGGRPLPQLAQVATLEAPAAARNLIRVLRGEPPIPYRHKPKGDLIALGRTHAGAQLFRLFGIPVGDRVFGGVLAWTIWRANYLTQLLGVRNRATLLAEWTLSYFFSRMVANTP